MQVQLRALALSTLDAYLGCGAASASTSCSREIALYKQTHCTTAAQSLNFSLHTHVSTDSTASQLPT